MANFRDLMSKLWRVLCAIWNLAMTAWKYHLPYYYYHYSGSAGKKAGEEEEFPAELRREAMPRHVAVILDGNRRWAKKRGLTHIEGYQAGLVALEGFLKLCVQWEIPIVSLFLFSSENWNRPSEEVTYLMEVFEDALRDSMRATFMRLEARVSIIGDTSLFPITIQECINQIEEMTKENTKCHMILAMSYGGQNDIVQACKAIATKVKEGLLEAQDISKASIEEELQTKVASVPCPDLLIRTSGEFRISNYYLWQSAYTEMYFTHTLWPDFDKEGFIKALHSFQQRGRRFGQI